MGTESRPVPDYLRGLDGSNTRSLEMYITIQCIINQQQYFEISALMDRKPVKGPENWTDMIHCPGASEDSGCCVFNKLQLSDQSFLQSFDLLQSTQLRPEGTS